MAKASPGRQPKGTVESSPPFAVVGIGASAGGFEAFRQVLDAMPANPRLSLVFVQHLAPQHGSALPTLLGAHSKLPVVEVTEGVSVEVNRVYVVPPNVQMSLTDGHLHLNPRPDDKTQYTPIDYFFRSLARALRNRAIGVVLSGTASDGADGIREIKMLGGTTLVQDPGTAKYDGMPRASIATRMVDLVLSPVDMAARLVQIAAHPLAELAPPARAAEPEPALQDKISAVSEKQLARVFKALYESTGVDFAHYKSPTIVRRLLRRMALVRIADVDTYLTHLEATSSEVINLHDDLLIHVTRFFREPQAFEALAREVLPELVADVRSDAPIRVWVAGCSTGEEAYSLGMVLIEALGDRSPDARVQIFGTDLSDGAIEFARHGVYPPSISADMSPERLRRFFTKSDGSCRVSKALRDLCVFARQDLTRDPPFSRLDIICCRNVLIYMDTSFQKKLLSMFHYALKPTGVLLLGHAESIGYNSELFTIMDKKHRIHRKKPGAGSDSVEVRITPPPPPKPDVSTKAAADARANTRVVLNEANRIVLDRYAPPSVLVDQNFHAVQFNGQTGLYLEPSPGEPSFHVLKLAREGLLHGLRTALQAAKKSRRPARRQALSVRNGSEWHEVDIEVIPMLQQSQMFFLVLFDGRPPEKKGKEGQPKAERHSQRAGAQEHRLAKLEEELAATREYLQSTVQEIEAANEELQSANEEILSSNEELQSTNEELDTAKEELQSANEELNTVNDELHGRNEELTRANADLVNLLSSVQIAIVIVSSDLRVRRFTPMAEKLLNLIPTDIGRSFTQISSNIAVPDLPALITETIEHVTPIERDVQDKQGHWYSLRIRPYKGSDHRIEGAVIVLFDIDAAKRYTQQLNQNNA